MRWRTGYEPDDHDPAEAVVEAASSADAVSRLRDVVGPDTDVLYVIPEAKPSPQNDMTYEDFLTDNPDPTP